MVLIIDNRPLYEESRKAYGRFNTVYSLVMKSEREGTEINDATRNVLQLFFYDAFRVPLEIRRQEPFTNLNDKLVEMVEKGFLKIKEKDITPFDPVTSNLYWKNTFEKFKEALN